MSNEPELVVVDVNDLARLLADVATSLGAGWRVLSVTCERGSAHWQINPELSEYFTPASGQTRVTSADGGVTLRDTMGESPSLRVEMVSTEDAETKRTIWCKLAKP